MAIRSALTEAGLVERVCRMMGVRPGDHSEVDAAIEDAIRCGHANAWDIRNHAERLLGYRAHH